jgi:DNA-directed RNA polymerase specialized sigma24 family protein
VRLLSTKQTSGPPEKRYATGADFCRIFEDDMDRLYRLSLLLTADPELAQKCFVRGLQDSKSGNRVFKEWAQSWARRTIITNAIRMIGPRPGYISQSVSRDVKQLPSELAPVLGLEAFDRFVFVMSVLEGYADRDCKLLLNCSTSDITQARDRALQQLGEFAELHTRNEINIESPRTADDRTMSLASAIRAQLAASA